MRVLTTQISIPSRYLVLLPDLANNVGISQRIHGEERERLLTLVKDKMQPICLAAEKYNAEKYNLSTQHATQQPMPYGFIIRTAAEGVVDEIILADIAFLCKIWYSVQTKVKQSPPLTLLYQDLPLKVRVLRDIVGMNVEKIRVDSKESYQEIHPIYRRLYSRTFALTHALPWGTPDL